MNQDENMKDSKYEEALERARQGRPIDEIFPELKESEDERIRKVLCYIVRDMPYMETELRAHGLTVEKTLAYLERQKEQKYYTYEQSKQAAENCYYDKGYNTEDGGRCNEQSFLWGFEEGVDWCEQQKERKYVDLTEMMVHEEPYMAPVSIPIVADEQKPAEQLGGTFTSYDMAKTFTEGQNYVIANPEKFGLCKPADWSEEEERHLYNAIEAVKYVYDISDGTNGFKCIEFLKSFRPQPHWKPSKEQMDHLAYAYTQLKLQKCYAPHVYESLGSLYDDLKKLI